MATTEVLIDDLILDLGNPRFDGLESQREALEKILVNQGKKLVNLAEDIATQGLSPAHRMIAIKSKGLKGKFTVMDGNRRLTALKILSNPAVLDPMSDVGDVTKRQLRNIAARFERKRAVAIPSQSTTPRPSFSPVCIASIQCLASWSLSQT